MFQYKKSFNFKEPSLARAPSSTAIKAQDCSPFKRIKLSEFRAQTPILKPESPALVKPETPPLLKPETPPLTPNNKFRSLIDDLEEQKEALCRIVDNLKEQVETRFNQVLETREKIIDLQSKRSLVESYIEIATHSQCEVRNLLNRIYNPGNQLADRAKLMISETRRGHQKKLEKMRFEQNHSYEAAKAAIERKEKELLHDIELNERTLLTINHQAETMDEAQSPIDESTKMAESSPSPELHDKEMDEDCVIIEDAMDQSAMESMVDDQTSQTSKDHSKANMNQSETTQTCESDDEQTDIDERSFTPCQAQRPIANK